MSSSVLPFGTQIAADVRDSSVNSTPEVPSLNTLGDLLGIWGTDPPKGFAMLRTTGSLLGAYLEMPVEQILLDSIRESRDGFRTFLEKRKYAENSIRTYVNYSRILLKEARALGWKPDDAIPEAWRGVLALAAEKQCSDIVKYLARIRKMPRDVTIEDVSRWAEIRIQQGLSYNWVGTKRTWFWRLLRDTGCTKQTPKCFLREKDYGTHIRQLPDALADEVIELLRWKQAAYARDRSKDGRHRAVTAKLLEQIICGLIGFAVNIRGDADITSLSQVVQKQTVDEYAEWCINVREVKGETIYHNLRLLSAAMLQHPAYKSLDLTWFKLLLESIPREPKSELKERKAQKYLGYNVVESIPGKIRAGRPAAEKKGVVHVARLVQEELVMEWIITLPWRQLNIREMRIGGPTPNLFKGKIPPFSDIDKPKWVTDEEDKNPAAEFWQFRFSASETKMGNEVRALLPRQLIGLLEEFLNDFRTHLLVGPDPGTLFVNQAGRPMMINTMTRTVGDLTLRHAGRRVTPHPFRDIIAFTWLKEHPEDYLTLSKMLWHATVAITIETYGGRFNESSGVSAMEAWRDAREAKSK